MGNNYIKINDTTYEMVSDTNETEHEMKNKGFTQVSDSEFDRLFNLYADVLDGKIKVSDIVINSVK